MKCGDEPEQFFENVSIATQVLHRFGVSIGFSPAEVSVLPALAGARVRARFCGAARKDVIYVR